MKSVTEVLDAYTEPEIWEWKLRVGPAKARRASEEALAIGKQVDQLIQDDIKGQAIALELLPLPAQYAWGAWVKFKAEHPELVKDITGIQVELVQGEIVGHPDIVQLKQVTDIKTSGYLTVRPKWIVQASKYALMAQKDRAAILLLSKAGPFYQYIYWEGEMLWYFGEEVFGAFEIVSAYQEVAHDMIRMYMEEEALA